MNQAELDEIIRGCIAGRRKSQKSLFDHFSDEMFGVCLYYSKDYTEAEDTLHEGFMKVFQKISQYKRTGSLAGWIKRIMINTALEKFRKQKLLFVVSDEMDPESDIEPERVINDLSAQDLIKMIGELTPQYRIVFNLYAIDGYSHKEISSMLGISEGTSKSNLARARYILQKKVKEYYYTTSTVKGAQ